MSAGEFRMTASSVDGSNVNRENPGAENGPEVLSSTVNLRFVSDGINPVVITYINRRHASTQQSFLGVDGFEITTQKDIDDDGLDDRWEVRFGVSDPDVDPDSDGLTNLQEQNLRLDPNNDDSDGDGFTDGIEVGAGSDPNDPNSTP